MNGDDTIFIILKSQKIKIFKISIIPVLQYWKFILSIFLTYLIIKKLRIVGNILFLFYYIALSSLLIDHELSDKIFFTTQNELRMNNWTTEEKYLPPYNRRTAGTHAIMYITNIWCYVIYMSWYRQSKKWVIFLIWNICTAWSYTISNISNIWNDTRYNV